MAQFARPDNDDVIGAWTDESAGTTDIYTGIDEVSAEDTEYIESEADPTGSTCTIGLSAVTDPEGNVDHIVRYRYQKRMSGGGSPGVIDLSVALREGVTVRASQSHVAILEGFVAGTFTLSGAEADAITDYSALNLFFTANMTGGTRTSFGDISWAEFEVPNAPGAGVNVDMTLGTMTVTAFNFDVVEGIDVDMTLGAISVAALNFTVVEGIDVAMTLGTVTVSPFSFTVVEGIEVDMTLGTVEITPYPWLIEAAAITQVRPDGLIMRPYGSFTGKASGAGVTVNMSLEAITVTAFNFDVIEEIDVSMTLGAITVTAYNFDIIEGVNVDMTLGTVTVTAFNFTIDQATTVDMTLGTVSVTSFSFDVVEGIEVDMTLGQVTVTPHNFTILAGSGNPWNYYAQQAALVG